jgi:hypothetical protein
MHIGSNTPASGAASYPLSRLKQGFDSLGSANDFNTLDQSTSAAIDFWEVFGE